MKKEKMGLFALLFVIAIAGVFVVGTYAKYTSEVNKSGNATVAKWDFATTNDVSMTVSLPSTVDASTLVNGKIAPGTAGSFTIKVTNASEVGADFKVALGNVTNKPTNLKFYKDSSYTTELTLGNATSGAITGQLIAGDTAGKDVTVYWRWEYETTGGDSADTTDGTAAATVTVPVTITGTQVQPGAAITSHID